MKERRMRVLDRGGVALAYYEAMGHRRPIVLVHGWCCDHSYFAPQIEHFARRGHRVVAMDLRGHGRSDRPEQTYTMGAFADDVAWICGALGLVRPVLIGHSMGGIVCFDLAARYRELASAVVMLDAAVVVPLAARASIPGFLEDLRGVNYRTVLREYVAKALFIPTDEAKRRESILVRMGETPQHVMISAFEGLRDYDPGIAKGELTAPVLYISADEPTPRSDMGRFGELVPDLLYGKTVGAGHFCQLEVPEQVNAMIDRFLFVNGIVPAMAAGVVPETA
jgi:pimeloyl-ACP methyl ester carboxylesterase